MIWINDLGEFIGMEIFTAIRPGLYLEGDIFPEPVRVLIVQSLDENFKIGVLGLRSGQYYERVLSPDQIRSMRIIPPKACFDGNAHRFRLGIEAARLSLAFKYDPHLSLSIARIDRFPHQLEAVYDFLLPLPRFRFLLADDADAGKTIMAGLSIEVKGRAAISPIFLTHNEYKTAGRLQEDYWLYVVFECASKRRLVIV